MDYDKVSKRNREENGKYRKWDTCDKCGESFGAPLDECFYAFDNGDVICESCVLNADPNNNNIENYEEVIAELS